jgi:hypothetical protein
MPIFLVVPLSAAPETLDKAVETHIQNPADRYKLQGGRGWLIHFNGTTIEVSNKLTITGQPEGQPAPVGSVIITVVSSYYGRGPTDMWEWIQTRMEK